MAEEETGEFDCNGPGIGPFMATLTANLDAILPGFELAFELATVTPPVMVIEKPDFDIEAALAVPGLAPALGLAAAIIAAIDLPPLPPPFDFGVELPGWDIEIQGFAILVPLEILLQLPIDLMIGMISFEVPVFPDVVVDLDLPFPGWPTMAGCVVDLLEPIAALTPSPPEEEEEPEED